jgi:hypothetical protein
VGGFSFRSFELTLREFILTSQDIDAGKIEFGPHLNVDETG